MALARTIGTEKNFVFQRKSFFDLVSLPKTTIRPNSNTSYFRSLSVAKKIPITLWNLKDMRSLGMTTFHFGVANCKASKVTFEVCMQYDQC